MSIESEIARIKQAKVDLRKAITAKGVTVVDTDRIDTYANKVAQIEGGSGEGFGKYRVRFFDYDGTILKTVYTDGGAVTAPNVPEHDRLLFQEWNNDFDDITDDLDVGAIYTTKSGKCEFDIDINSLTGLTQYVGIKLTSGTVTIEWGDGQTETLSTVGETRIAHTYTSYGRYTQMVSGTAYWGFLKQCLAAQNGGTNSSVVAIRLANLPSVVVLPNEPFYSTFACVTLALDKSTHTVSKNTATFARMVSLTHINVPRAVELNDYAFAGCHRLRHVTMHINAAVLGREAFDATSLEDITIPTGISKILSGTFRGSGGLQKYQKVTIPFNVALIEAQAFVNAPSNGYGFGNLKTVVLRRNSPPTISSNSFMTDGSLKEIIVPAGCAEAYKSATNWSAFADIIKEEEI